MQQRANEKQQAMANCAQLVQDTQAELVAVNDLQAAVNRPGQPGAAAEVLQHNLALAR